MNDNKESEKCVHSSLFETLLEVVHWDGEEVLLEIQDVCEECGALYGVPYVRRYNYD